jgi:leucyl aminopeptidase
MHFSVISESPSRQKSDCVVVAVHTSRALSDAAEALNRSSRGQLSEQLKIAPMTGKAGETLTLYGVRGVTADRVLLVGMGPRRGLSAEDYVRAVNRMANALLGNGAATASTKPRAAASERHDRS